MIAPANPPSLHPRPFFSLHAPPDLRAALSVGGPMRATMLARSLNRRQLHRGRELSVEAIQAVQALKRANGGGCHLSLQRAFDSRFRRLLKLDMIAVLRELLRQNQCSLALKVFEDIRKEHWYKPQVSLYADMIGVLATNGLLQQLKVLYFGLRRERNMEPELDGFNNLLRTFISCGLIELAVDCYGFMKDSRCEPNMASFRILINGLESMNETSALTIIKQDARMCYGESLEFVQEKEELEC